ncbi:MAG: ribonuclease III [Anaerolineae bacterium]|nr:MAG: ribonuclease III [Anaerolineae bacterium]
MSSTQGYPAGESPRAFAQRVGLEFGDWGLLTRALTHRSFINEHPGVEDNERLEFLGDAVLDFVVGAWLYNQYPEMAEGELTRMRSALVRTEQLAGFARQIGLGDALRLGRGEAESGGRERSTLLCAAFEALIGALYLDGGLPAVTRFITPLLAEAAPQIYQNGDLQDPKSRLQELTQAHGQGAPVYRTVAAFGPDHDKTFEVVVLVDGEVVGRGQGHSKQAAAKQAAREALRQISFD